MFPLDPSEAYDDMSPELRHKLAAFLEARNEYRQAAGEADRRKIIYLYDPTPEAKKYFEDFAEAFVAPAREKMGRLRKQLTPEMVDMAKLKEVLPMALLAVSQAVNIPLILATLDADPDEIKDMQEFIKDFFHRGFDAFE